MKAGGCAKVHKSCCLSKARPVDDRGESGKEGRSPSESCGKGGNQSCTIKAVYNVFPSPKYPSQWYGKEAPSIWLTTVLSPTSSSRTPAFVWEDENQTRLSSSTADIGGARDWRLSLPAEVRPSINQALYYGHISSGSKRKTQAQPLLSRQKVAKMLNCDKLLVNLANCSFLTV